MSGLISDVLEGRVTPGVCNAAVNAGGKLLKVVEMQQRYGKVDDSEEKELVLCRDGGNASRLELIEQELKALRAELD